MSDTTVAGSTLGPAESKNGPPVHLPPAVERTVTARIPTADGAFYLHHFRSAGDGKNHLALVLGEAEGDDLLVRIHSECFTGDVLGSQRCDCGEQLTRAMQAIAAEGRGALIYLRQEGRGIGLEEKLRAYNLQDEGYDTVDANLLLGHQADERDYTAAALILQELGVRSVRMLTNNPAKIEGLAGLGIAVRERIPLQMPSNPESHAYLEAKVARMRHIIRLNGRGGTEKKKENEEKKGEREHLAYGQGEAYRPQLDGLRARIQSHNCGEAEENSNKNAFLLTPRPFVTLSYAQSLDGCLTTQQGMATPISAPASLTMTHTLRATHRAILVGIETVLADDPALTVRLIAGDNPQPVIVDSHLRTPPGARLLQSCGAPWIATTPEGARSSRRQRLEEAGGPHPDFARGSRRPRGSGRSSRLPGHRGHRVADGRRGRTHSDQLPGREPGGLCRDHDRADLSGRLSDDPTGGRGGRAPRDNAASAECRAGAAGDRYGAVGGV